MSPPERKHYGTATEAADVYSVGVMLHEILIAYPPVARHDNPTGGHQSIPPQLCPPLEAMLAPTAVAAAASVTGAYSPVCSGAAASGGELIGRKLRCSQFQFWRRARECAG